MEQTTLERRVHVIPAAKPTSASAPRRGGKQRVAAYCRVSTDSEEQLNSYAAQKNYGNTAQREQKRQGYDIIEIWINK